jgi:pilus assembly protein CpaE
METHQILRAIILAPDPELTRGLERRIASSGRVLVVKTLDRYLSSEETAGAIRAHSAQVMFVDVASNPAAIDLASHLQRVIPGLSAVALDYACPQELLMSLLHAGIREVLCPPFPETPYLEALGRIGQAVSQTSNAPDRGEVVAFVPSKGGSGASTLAVNTALALARLDIGKILLADFDLSSGVVRFQLKHDHPFSVMDVLDNALRLDESIWPDMVGPVAGEGGTLDVIPSGAIYPRYPHPGTHVAAFLEFAQKRYRRILLDLSGQMEQYAVDMLAQCRSIYLVIQPELASVYLAREKLRFLKTADLEDRVEVLLNRWKKDAVLTLPDIEGVLGMPVAHSFSNDPKEAYQALLSGKGIGPASSFGREIGALGEAIAAEAAPKVKADPAGRKRRIEFFSVLPAKYSLFPSQR